MGLRHGKCFHLAYRLKSSCGSRLALASLRSFVNDDKVTPSSRTDRLKG